MFSKILVSTDGSELSQKAVDKAIELASQLKAELVGVHVYSPYPYPIYGEFIPPEMPETYLERVKEEATNFLQKLKTAAEAKGIKTTVVSKESFSPWEAIIETTKEQQCDGIVMASHGRRGVASLLLGSETQKVLTHSNVPVLVIR
ncbi:universal stress protein [Ampullimonas aquatilis]|uniref:universal stress protein n=1 Tax=Ampullimonas aquatilis TaxID=1341549 RepID=UPI003C78A029